MEKSIVLIIVGVILIAMASEAAENLPVRAFKDFSKNQQLPHDHTFRGVYLNTEGQQKLFIQIHTQRRLLQNFYMGASGLICLAAGLLAFPKKKTPDIPVKSK